MVPTENRFGYASAFLYDRYGERAGQDPRCRGVDRPLGTVTGTANGGNLVAPYMVRHRFGEVGWTSVEQPLQTICAQGNHFSVIAPSLYTNVIGQQPGQRCDRPLGVITSVHNKFNLLVPFLYEHANSTWSNGSRDANAPMPTLTAGPKGGSWNIVEALTVKYYGRGENVLRCDEPLDTVTGRDRFGVAAAHLTKLRGSGGWCSLTDPLDTICAGATTFGLTSAWVVKHYGGHYDAAGIDARSPLDTITAVDHHAVATAFITHMRGTNGHGVGGNGQSARAPLPTLTATNHIYSTQASLALARSAAARQFARAVGLVVPLARLIDVKRTHTYCFVSAVSLVYSANAEGVSEGRVWVEKNVSGMLMGGIISL